MRRLVQNTFAEPDDPGALAGEPLVIHQRSEPTRNRALVVFVHGLGGHRYGRDATWGYFPQFLFEDFPDVDVGLYEYVTLFRRLKFWQSIQLSQEAIVFADLIRDVAPYDAVILVGHSMGGLLCEAAVASLVNTAQEQGLRKIRGMILMASPQTGSQRVPSFLSSLSKDAYALRPHGDFVTSLQRTLIDRISLLESGDPGGRYQIPSWAILGSYDAWVDRLSGSIGLPSSQTKTVRGSHTQIVKPASKQNDGYDFFCACTRKILARCSLSAEAQRSAAQHNSAVRTPASRMPAVGIFFDRKEILARFVEFLNDRTRQLMVVGGLPGIGKSTLAAKAAADSALHFKDVFWMTCSREHSTVDVLLEQLHSFLEKNGDESLRGLWNAPLPDVLPAKIDAIVEALHRNAYFLIFDEFASWLDDQLQVKNPEVRSLLHGLISSAHQSKILLIAERRPFFDPESDPIPPGIVQNEELFGLAEADAIGLLKQYLPAGDEDLLRRIVRTCGANPRLLNWFGYLVSQRRQDAQALLASEGGTLSAKLLSGSVADLTPESREALERLSIFRWPLTNQDLDRMRVSFQTAVVPLLGRFLATWYEQDNSVSIAEPVKSFVRTRIEPGKLRALHLAAVDFYAAEQPAADPSTFADVLPILEKAYHLAETGQGQESADALLSVVRPLTEWGYLDLVRDEVGRVLETLQPDALRRARCLWTLADIQDLRSDHPAALNLFAEASQAFETVQDYEDVARCRWRVGRVRNALGDLPAALEDFRVCIEICDRRNVKGPKAAAFLEQGWALAQQGDRDRALALMEQSLELATQSDDFETQAGANRQIGWILWDYRREGQQTRECYRRAREIAASHGLLKELGAVYGDLGYLNTEWDDTQAAEENSRAAIEIRQALGDQYGLAGAYMNLGLVFRARKAYAEENRSYDDSLVIYRRLRVPGGEAEVLLRQGIAWREQAELGESEKTLRQALGIIQEHDLKLTLADVLYELGRTLLLAGRTEEAHTCLAKAVAEAENVKSPRAVEFAQFLGTAST